MTNPNYSAAEIEFLQCLLDRYSGTGNLVRADDNPAFMAIVRKHYGEPLSDRASMNPAAVREVVEALEDGVGPWLAAALDDRRASPALKREIKRVFGALAKLEDSDQ